MMYFIAHLTFAEPVMTHASCSGRVLRGGSHVAMCQTWVRVQAGAGVVCGVYERTVHSYVPHANKSNVQVYAAKLVLMGHFELTLAAILMSNPTLQQSWRSQPSRLASHDDMWRQCQRVPFYEWPSWLRARLRDLAAASAATVAASGAATSAACGDTMSSATGTAVRAPDRDVSSDARTAAVAAGTTLGGLVRAQRGVVTAVGARKWCDWEVDVSRER